jgi:hypothetical protein
MTNKSPNEIIGANAGLPSQLPMRTPWATHVAQFFRWANETGEDI